MKYELSTYQQDLRSTWVRSAVTQKMGAKTTIVHLTLKNGFEVVGVSGCEDPAKYDKEIGKHFAMINALDKVDELTAFARAGTPNVLVQTESVAPEVLEAIRKEVRSGMIEAVRSPGLRNGMY